jgi:hypothetical protein
MTSYLREKSILQDIKHKLDVLWMDTENEEISINIWSAIEYIRYALDEIDSLEEDELNS